MKITGFTFVRNVVENDYPVVDSLRSIFPMVNECIMNVRRCDDGTFELIRLLGGPKLIIVESVWDETLRKDGDLCPTDQHYCGEAHREFAGTMFDGIVGSCVMIKRATYDTLGSLDERIQPADWELYCTLRKREQIIGDMKRCMVVGASFVHHFIQARIKSRREPFGRIPPRRSIPEKWSMEEQEKLWRKPSYFRFVSDERSFQQILRRNVGKPLKKLVQEFNRAFAWHRRYVNSERIGELHRRQFQTLGTIHLRTGVSQS